MQTKLIILVFGILTFQVTKSQSAKALAAKDASQGTFYDIRNKDFAQLIGASSPGVNLSYSTDKTSLGGSLTLASITKEKNEFHPMWFQLQGSIGTTTTLYTLGDNTPQLDFTFMPTFTRIFYNMYYFDRKFTANYSGIKSGTAVGKEPKNMGYVYNEALSTRLNAAKPELTPAGPLYVRKKIFWITAVPELGGSRLTYYNKAAVFGNQIY